MLTVIKINIMKNQFLSLVLLALAIFACSEDDNENESNLLINQNSLIGTWEASEYLSRSIGAPFDRNSDDNTCDNKPDFRDVINESLIAFTEEIFLRRINETELGSYGYDTPVINNGILNCDPSGMRFFETENTSIDNDIEAFQNQINNIEVSNKTILLNLENNIAAEIIFENEQNIEVFALTESSRTSVGKFNKISNDVNTQDFLMFLVEQ